MWIVSVISLSIVAALCLIGVFHRAFRDNILQCIGMSGLCIACFGRIGAVWTTEFTAPSWMLVHLFMAIYAVGTALKVVLINGREAGWSWLVDYDKWLTWRKSERGDFDSKPHHHWWTAR